ncbi:MAG: hypothetical protein HN790_10615 [Methylococcales bacterium]|jgi:hypothetical protein|nr:hypothetical protein [Methylococcales bacterium]
MNKTPSCHESLAHILRYPLHKSIMVSLVGYAFLMALASDFAYGVVTFFLYLMVFRYGFAILGSTARGMNARGLNERKSMTHVELRQSVRIPLQQMVVFALIIGIALNLQVSSTELAILFLAGVSLVMPASIITLAITRDCTLALNPLVLIQFIKTIGWSYFGLQILSLALTVIATAFISAIMSLNEMAVESSFALVLVEMVLHLVLIYFFVVISYLYGYVVREHHEALGVEQITPFVASSAPTELSPKSED